MRLKIVEIDGKFYVRKGWLFRSYLCNRLVGRTWTSTEHIKTYGSFSTFSSAQLMSNAVRLYHKQRWKRRWKAIKEWWRFR